MIPKLFIHIPKNAGTTVRLSPVLKGRVIEAGRNNLISKEYTDELLSTMKQQGDHHGMNHARWRDIKPSVRNGYQCFAVARNPWDRVVSRYFFAKKVVMVERKEPVGKYKIDSFEHFLEERHEWGGKPYQWHRAIRGWYPAADYVTDEDGHLRCDMLRFENLDSELCRYFNIPKMDRPRNVTRLNPGTYMDVYTPKTIQIVADWYKADIDMWGYDFDTGAKRNIWTI